MSRGAVLMRPLLAFAALALACNPYDPTLGDTPFRCGTDEPRCPDGYLAVEESVVRCICERAATAPDGGPSDYVCDGDPFENPTPNDAIQFATPVDFQTNMTRDFVNLAVCPRDDVDYYTMNIARVGSVLVVRVIFDTTRSSPRIDIVDDGGVSLRPTLGNPQVGVLTAELATQFPGAHLAKISADVEVNYDLTLSVTPPENP